MKILYVQDSLGTGGAERSNAELWFFLLGQKINFKVLVLDRRKVGIETEILEKGIDVIFLSKSNFFNEARQIAAIIKDFNPDIVHSVLFRSTMRVRLSKIFTSFFHLESLVNTTYSRERLNDLMVNQNVLKVYKYLDILSAHKGVDHFHSITETVKNHYVKEVGLNQQKITVIPRGRKPILKNIVEKSFVTKKTFQLINVGRHEFQKGQIHLLRAMRILKKQNYKFHLTILGRDGSETQELKKYIQENDLNSFVKLEGFKNNVSDYLIESDIFVFPSLYEGLGGALIEAQAAGLPIACNDIPVLHEVVRKDFNAKFFNVHDVTTIASSIQYFLDNPENLNQFGSESLKNFEDKFDLLENNNKMLNLYQHLC